MFIGRRQGEGVLGIDFVRGALLCCAFRVR